MATSGSKTKIFNRLRARRAHEEPKIALELANELHAEDQRRPVAISVPKLPTRAEQHLHFLTHRPYAAWYAYCVAHRGKEDHRKSEERNEKKERGRSVIFSTTVSPPLRGKMRNANLAQRYACQWLTKAAFP